LAREVIVRRRAFTLIELLVVIGIIIALAALLLPAVHRAYLAAQRTAIAADLQVIANALDAYRNDFGDYPRPGGKSKFSGLAGALPDANGNLPGGAVVSGPQILCGALVAPGPASEDGKDGPGFRLRGVTGKVYGPYIPADRFTVGRIDTSHQTDDASFVTTAPPPNGDPLSDSTAVLADRMGRVILYYPGHKGAHPSSEPHSYVATFWRPRPTTPPDPPDRTPPLGWYNVPLGPNPDDKVETGLEPRWNVMDGPANPMLLPPYLFRQLLGAAADGSLAPGNIAIDAPYLLISAGTASPQDLHGPFGLPDNVANVPLYTPSRNPTK